VKMRKVRATREELDAVDAWADAIVAHATRFRDLTRAHELDASAEALTDLLDTIGPKLLANFARDRLDPERLS
jgi:hypothetical protein